MTDQYTDNYISSEEAADYLGVKASTIRSWIKNITLRQSCNNDA